jgi:ubiquinone/menaquinone biosynthesis C-methylase UbiE
MNEHPDIVRNRRAHDRIAGAYDRRHDDIFNEVEQARLAETAGEAIAAVRNDGSGRLRALDIGAGTGNLTRHLLEEGAQVTAGDVSPGCLAEVERRFAETGRVETKLLDGAGLGQFADGSFDLVACYSVLHHVPDYLALVHEMARVVRTGGVVYIDHERHDASWLPSPARDAFLREAIVWPKKNWRRFVRFSSYWRRIRPRLEWRRWLNPRWMPEGDLHIWPDDHIQWAGIVEQLAAGGVEVVAVHDYLLYEARYQRAAW